MLVKRFVAGLVLVAIVVTVVWLGEPFFSIVLTIIGLISVYEFYHIVAQAKAKPLLIPGLIGTALFISLPHFELRLFLPLLLTSMVVVPLSFLIYSPQKQVAFSRWVWTIAGVIYIGWLLSYLVSLRNGIPPLKIDDTAGRNWLLYALLATFASDSTAFFIGNWLGRHRLCHEVSPRKSCEGAIGGMIGAVIISLLFTLNSPLALSINPWLAVLIGILASVFGQLGDLVESLLKRNMGVKDSSHLIPGHGGLLDRIDSVVFAVITVYYCVLLLG